MRPPSNGHNADGSKFCFLNLNFSCTISPSISFRDIASIITVNVRGVLLDVSQTDQGAGRTGGLRARSGREWWGTDAEKQNTRTGARAPGMGEGNGDVDWDQDRIGARHGCSKKLKQERKRFRPRFAGPRGGPFWRYGTKNRWTVLKILWTLGHTYNILRQVHIEQRPQLL